MEQASDSLNNIRKQMISIELCKDLKKIQHILVGLSKYDSINQIEKIGQKIPKHLKRAYNYLTGLLLVIIIAAMAVHRSMV